MYQDRGTDILAGKEERLAIWQQLIDTSTLDERNAVLDMIYKRNDLLPTRPTELVLLILDYLPTFEFLRLQRICKSWRSLFSSEAVVRACLNNWKTHDPSDSARDAQQLESQTTGAKLRHVQALRCGRPFSQATYEESDVFNPDLESNDFPQLKGTRLAWICRPKDDCNSVVVRDLVSGGKWVLYGDARENIIDISLSSTLIAFTTYSGKLYTQDFSPGSPIRKSVRLPSASLIALHADQHVVAVMMKCSGRQYRYSVAIFDFMSGATKLVDNLYPSLIESASRDVGMDLMCISSLLMVNCRDQVVDLFDYAFDRSDDAWEDLPRICYIEHSRYSFDGQRILGSVSEVVEICVLVDPSTPKCHPSGFEGIYTLTLPTSNIRAYDIPDRRPTAPWPPDAEACSLNDKFLVRGYVARFDYRTGELEHHPKEELRGDEIWEEDGPALKGFHQAWKDLNFHRVEDPHSSFLITINPKPESARGKGRGRLLTWLWQEGNSPNSEPQTSRPISLHVNDTFVVACYQTHRGGHGYHGKDMKVLVACFDEGIPVAESQPTHWWDYVTDDMQPIHWRDLVTDGSRVQPSRSAVWRPYDPQLNFVEAEFFEEQQ